MFKDIPLAMPNHLVDAFNLEKGFSNGIGILLRGETFPGKLKQYCLKSFLSITEIFFRLFGVVGLLLDECNHWI